MTLLAAALREARSLRFERDAPVHVDAIVIVGATCTGKTTLVDELRRAALAGIEIPRRFVTRAPRADDLPAEAGHLSAAELDAGLARGDLHLHWSRTLDDQTERYAFATPRPGVLAVYSANNAIYLPDNARPPGALANALFVGIYAPDEIRAQRLRARSPELCRDRPDEVRARLAETADAMRPHVHVVVENHGALEAPAKSEIVRLVRAVTSSAERRP